MFFLIVNSFVRKKVYLLTLFTRKQRIFLKLLFLLDNVFWYFFIIFIDFLEIKSLLTSILLSYLCKMGISWKSCCSIVSNKCSRTRSKGIWSQFIPRCFIKGFEEKTKLIPHICSFNFLLREIIYMLNRN